jgi:FG-GAP repeat protein
MFQQGSIVQGRISAAVVMGFALMTSVMDGAPANRPRPDFNGDGVADLAIGAPGQGLQGGADVGTVHVVCGQPGAGLGATRQHINAGMIALVEGVSGNQAGLEFGRVLAWGDFNGDHFDDLAIGMPKYDAGVWINAGLVYVLYGGPSNGQWPCGVRTVGVHHFLSTYIGPIDANLEINDYFGAALAAGDFDGDGFDDLAIGAPGQDGWDGQNIIPDAGEVYVVYGTPAGLNRNHTQGWSQNGRTVWPDIADHPAAGDQFGFSLAAGDFNADGRDDLAIGVPGENQGRGAVNVIYGSAQGLHRNLVVLNQFWHEDVADVPGVSAPGERFGFRLASGDFNLDGRDDLAISAPYATLPGLDPPGCCPLREFSGEVVILYGASLAGLRAQRFPATGGGAQLIDQLTPGIVDDGFFRGDLFGFSLAAGDFNGDGTADLAIGKPGDDPGAVQGQTVDSSGSVTIVFGVFGVMAGLNPAMSQYWLQASEGVPGTVGDNENFGWSLFAGDFDRNGVADLAIGVPKDSINGVRCGSVNVLYFGAGARPHQILTQPMLGGGICEPGDRFGIVGPDWTL